ncbi:MAG: glycosyl hydrolase 115 family protein [Bacteroidales bacterium]|nr:glycosyl hydrolase 115 family protein [Bacteroidales bacterium]
MGFSIKKENTDELNPVLFEKGKVTYMYIGKNEKPVVYAAFELLKKDVRAVFDADLQATTDKKKAQIIVASSKELQGKWETFETEFESGKLVIRGSDARGKAYGMLEVSRSIGVSPWEWWADVTPEKRSVCLLGEIEKGVQSPSVQYRGIFLNDEDWGLMPWATEKFGFELIDGVKLTDNKNWKGAIGPGCYERIFQLLLRLRANTLWPAMHECTVPFYFVKGNREMADKYGIVVGTSHCEPLMRNSASEWDIAGKGEYNFMTNRPSVLEYWSERLKELKDSENLFTIGMRGKHDGMMQGVKTLEEHKKALTQIIPAQQELLGKYIDPKPEKIPQIFVPYKEVLDVYDNGLDVPDYVTLVWCDDNYGYINRLSDEKEQLRKGGAGVYYHLSYWGRPHDYLWLSSTSPALVYSEMKRAYDQGAKKLWIVNVGDIKPAEYLIDFFMDMAWDVHSVADEKARTANVFSHLNGWAEREFGKQEAGKIAGIMKEYYRLANFRKPEFMGFNRVEESGIKNNRSGITPVTDSEYNPDFKDELQRRLDDYLRLDSLVKEVGQAIPDYKKNAFFQLVKYPVEGASLMNRKWLCAQLAHHYTAFNRPLAIQYAGKSLRASDEIERITGEYNRMENGKWNGIMDAHPRKLPVFAKPDFATLDSLINAENKPVEPEKKEKEGPSFVMALNADQAVSLPENARVIEGLGHSFSAVQMQQGNRLAFTFEIPEPGTYWIKIGTLPNHDVDGKGMKISLSVDGKEIKEFDYRTVGRSEEWKQNVLRGQVVSSTRYDFPQAGKVTVSVSALTPYIILDQIMIGKGEERFYEFPVK